MSANGFGLDNLGNLTRFAFDVIDVGINIRRHLHLGFLNLVRDSIGDHGAVSQLMKNSVDWASMATSRQYLLEEDLLNHLQGVLTGDKSISSHRPSPPARPLPPSARPKTWRPALPNGGSIKIVAPLSKSLVVVPITLRNHLNISQTVILHATSFKEAGTAIILQDRISFKPAQIELPAGKSARVLAAINLSPNFLEGKEYAVDILIDGDDPRRLPLKLVIAPEAETDARLPLPAFTPEKENSANEEAEA